MKPWWSNHFTWWPVRVHVLIPERDIEALKTIKQTWVLTDRIAWFKYVAKFTAADGKTVYYSDWPIGARRA